MSVFAFIIFTHMQFATAFTCYIFNNDHNGRPDGCNSDNLYNVRMIVINQASTFFQQRLRLFLCECFFTRFHCYRNILRLINSFVNHSKVALCDRRMIDSIENQKKAKTYAKSSFSVNRRMRTPHKSLLWKIILGILKIFKLYSTSKTKRWDACIKPM